VPRLVVLNGPPGIGKSTLARRYIEEHPLALSLELDVLRGLLGGWRERETESGRLARALSLDMVRTHLDSGHDVVVPQFVAVPDYLDQLAALGAVEAVLMAPLELAEQRFRARDTEHGRVAVEVVEEAGGYAVQYARLAALLEVRRPLVLDATDLERAYTDLLAAASMRA
jgi:predicted kinase